MKNSLFLTALALMLSGCVATKVVTTTAKVATKVTVGAVGTTAKVATGTAGLLIPDGDDEEDQKKAAEPATGDND